MDRVLRNWTTIARSRDELIAETRCYLCGEVGADTTEHVVARCFYGATLPRDMLTLPAHFACNRHTARFEENLKNRLAGCIPPEHARASAWPITRRALARPQAAGMKAAFYADLVDGYGGAVGTTAIQIDDVETNWVLAKIVKGLLVAWDGRLIRNRAVAWRFGHAWTQADPGVSIPNQSSVHDVVDVRWGIASDDDLASLWILTFYGVETFWAMTTPWERRVSNKQRGAQCYLWPPRR